MNRTLAGSLAALALIGCASSNPAARTDGTAQSAAARSDERERLVQNLEQTRRAFVASVQGLSETQLRFRPAPDRWSIAEVAEHIAISEDRIFGMISEKVLRAPAPPELRPQTPSDDERVLKAVLDRGTRRQAPEMLKPTGSFPTTEAAVTAFTKGRDRTVGFVQTTKDDLRAHGGPHPALKLLDGYQWLLLLSGHSARHTAQIEEIKADPGFPKS
ncbi:MAG: DinB family protein [Polyangia bacterium]